MMETVEAYVDDSDDDPDYKPEPNKAIKVELEEHEDDLRYFDDMSLHRGKRIKTEAGSLTKARRLLKEGRQGGFKRDLDMFFDGEDEGVVTGVKRGRGRPRKEDSLLGWQDKADTRVRILSDIMII